jgi:TPP-dependent 2-oxoacid decarboxylase
VGAFSAFNGIGSAYAEGLSVILISGVRNTNDVAQSRLLHHSSSIRRRLLGSGQRANDKRHRQLADGIICIGTRFTDYSTVGWTVLPDISLLEIDMDLASLRNMVFRCVSLGDVLIELSKLVALKTRTIVEYNRIRPNPTLMTIAGSHDALERKDVV